MPRFGHFVVVASTGARSQRAFLGKYVLHCFAAETPPRVQELAVFLAVSPRTLHRDQLEKRNLDALEPDLC